MAAKTGPKVEFGNFQTPDILAHQACQVLLRLGVSPKSIVEPTCGKGTFLRASQNAFPECSRSLGFEINPDYAQIAKSVEQSEIHCENFFQRDWPGTLDGLQEPVLVIGNPPWVTNSAVGSLGGTNLPPKSNYQRLSGFDAATGKSNFDVSEWMLSHLLGCLSGRKAVLAMLCKTSVARKVLQYAWTRELQVAMSAIYAIDSARHFGVSVDACLLVCELEPGKVSRECLFHQDVEETAPDSIFAFYGGRLVADLDAAQAYSHLCGTSPLKWRSGIKHDCSRIMELYPKGGGKFENGLGEIIRLEPNYLYPMLKSSELMKSALIPSRHMLVTQQSIGEDTTQIKHNAPRTWSYLQSHADHLGRRASSIYRNHPKFSIFGVGPYSFSPWKVAISGFYKRLDFRCVGPTESKPIVLDDTCYFLPCQTERDAKILIRMLNSKAAKGFFRSFIFWDAKRPITAQLLASLDLRKLAKETGVSLPLWTNSRQDTFLELN